MTQTHLIFAYLALEGMHPSTDDCKPGYRRHCLTPNGESLAQEGHDGGFLLDGEKATLEGAFPALLGEGLRSRMALLATPRHPEALLMAFTTMRGERDFITALGGRVFIERDSRGEITLLREAREGDPCSEG
jgi:hypothetical protein